MYVSWTEQDKILISQPSPPKFRTDQRGDPWKWILKILKCKNEFPKRLGLEKQMKSNGIICLVFMAPSWVMVLNLSKIVSFMQFFADISRKLNFFIAIYVYASESSNLALSEDGIG